MATENYWACVLLTWVCWTILSLPRVSTQDTYPRVSKVYGLTGRPVMLECGDAIMNGSERLTWAAGLGPSNYSDREVVATGYYVNGTLIRADYGNRLVNGRAELNPNGSIIIYRYDKEDKGDYDCYSEYRSARFNLDTFRPWIGPLYDMWRYGEQPNITCRASYYKNKSVAMAFIWELVRPNGNITPLPGDMKPSVKLWDSFAIYTSALSYTLSTDDIQSILRCTVRLEDETLDGYEAKVEEPIPHYSRVYGFPGRPVMLECGDAMVNGREQLYWFGYTGRETQYFFVPAIGIYVDGRLTNVSYPYQITASELAPNGSLIINSYGDIYNGVYRCSSEYRAASSDLTTFGVLPPPEPDIRGVDSWLFITEENNISCHVCYHWTENVTFVWELDGGVGRQLFPSGYMESVVQHRNNTATFVWALNFTLEYNHSGYKLRCFVRVNNEIHRKYESKDEVDIRFGNTYVTMVTSKFNEAPTSGKDYILQCVILTEDRPTETIHYTWSKNGKNLNELDKYAIDSDYFIIKDYEEDVDSGAYGCSVTTDTGRTKIGEIRYLNVTSVRHAKTDNSAIAPSTVALSVTLPTNILLCVIVLYRKLFPKRSSKEMEIRSPPRAPLNDGSAAHDEYSGSVSEDSLSENNYQLIDGSRIKPTTQERMEASQAQGSELGMNGPVTPVKVACIDRKLPRTPDEYTKLKGKACAAKSYWRPINDMATCSTKQLQPSTIPQKVDPPPRDNISESSNTLYQASEYDEGATGFHPYIVVLHEGTGDDVKQTDVLPSTQSVCPATSSDGKKDGYEKLNSETMDSYRGSVTAHDKKISMLAMKSQTCSADLNDESIPMRLDDGTSQAACPVTRAHDKTSEYEKLNPETMDSYQISTATGYEKLNKATMEPRICSADLDGSSITKRLDERTSQDACPGTRSDEKMDDHEKLNPETMNNYQESTTSGYEKLNKATTEPQTRSAYVDRASITKRFDERISERVCPGTRSDEKTGDYEKLNPETMGSYQGSATTGYEKLNKATMEPHTGSIGLDGNSITKRLNEIISQNACHRTRSHHNTGHYQKLNPEMMDNYQGCDTTVDEKPNDGATN